MKTVLCNYSAASCNDLFDVFKAMFGDGVPSCFSLGRTKLSYIITEALGPYFRNILLEECNKVYYTLIYDETTNVEGKKELQIALRYWSDQENEIVTCHLETFFIASATGEKLEEYIMQSLHNSNMSHLKMLMLGRDGPNVNKKVFRLINGNTLSSRGCGLIDMGTCNIHIVHNDFLKGLDVIGMSVSEFIVNGYYFFNGWPKRCEEFTNIQIKLAVTQHKFIKHCSSRWLTLGKAALRIIEQWDCLIEYFTIFIPKKCSNLMTAASASMYENFSILSQRQEPLIHVLHNELKKLILIISGRICKQNVLIKWSGDESVFDSNNLLTIPQLPSEVSDLLNNSNTKEIEKKIFTENVKKHYINGALHILNKSSYGVSPKIKYFRCLQPPEIKKERSCYDIGKVAHFLPVKVDITMLSDEWKLLKLENLTYVS